MWFGQDFVGVVNLGGLVDFSVFGGLASFGGSEN